MPSDPELLSTPQAARRIGVSSRTLQRYVSEGHLQPTLLLPSGQARWDLDDLRAQLRPLRDPS